MKASDKHIVHKVEMQFKYAYNLLGQPDFSAFPVVFPEHLGFNPEEQIGEIARKLEENTEEDMITIEDIDELYVKMQGQKVKLSQTADENLVKLSRALEKHHNIFVRIGQLLHELEQVKKRGGFTIDGEDEIQYETTLNVSIERNLNIVQEYKEQLSCLRENFRWLNFPEKKKYFEQLDLFEQWVLTS